MKKYRVNRVSMGRLLKRREMLGLLGATSSVWLAGCLGQRSNAIAPNTQSTQASTLPTAQTAIAATPTCIVRPQQTEGPYFVDEKLNRSDIRSDPSDGSMKPGVPLKLVFQVTQVSNNACTPLSGAVVDIWHCDAQGIYSDVGDRSFNTVGKKFLRGYQVTDSSGMVEFLTIYPGWYAGRTVHIHFKIRTQSAAQASYEFTSQLYFDDRLTDQIHAEPPYATKGQRSTRNDQDGIFQSGGQQLLVALTKDSEFYTGRFDIGLQL